MSFLPWPRSLFGRLALLLIAMLLVGQVAAIYLFRLDRAALIERQFSDTKLVELRSLRAALASAEPGAGEAALTRIGEAYHARIISDQARKPGVDAERRFAAGPLSPLLLELEQRLKAELGPETELRIQPRLQLLWIKLVAGDRAYWAGFPLPTRSAENVPSRALQWSVVILAVLLPSAYAFARYLARPLRQLNAAVASVGEGKSPPPLPESGPSEIVNLNRGFNQMMSNLSQMEQDRAVLLAGVSHDLRTPLARLRLGIEVATADERTRQGMAEDIEEMDRIISQFLDFARPGGDCAVDVCDPGEIVATVAARHQRAGHDVRFAREELPKVALRATAFERMISNLVDNALRHGAPPVELAVRAAGGTLTVEVADHGSGIRAENVEYLKRPFTRGDPARGGAPGAGLGLAIVERIARLHGGTLDLAPRAGGGMVARVTIPLARAA
ncbi:MAG TPA: ATP-binding protein [Casimicrobiaceae bacterium]|nr:ATP-binding protein [Casimicrobiaceae bacterium]